MNHVRQRIALVAPFFGRDERGRKERFAFAYATHLSLEGIALEVITTTARSDSPGENFYRSGIDLTEPFPVHRCRVAAPDRAAYDEAVLAVQHDRVSLGAHGAKLITERLRSPDVLAHVRAVVDRYDAVVFIDATAPTTVGVIGESAEKAIVVPLLDDEPIARVRDVAVALEQARAVLCTSEAEAALVAELYGPAVRERVRIIGLAADVVPPAEIAAERVRRTRPYVLVAGTDRDAIGALHDAGADAIMLADSSERDRAALFAGARAVVVVAERRRFIPEIVEAWSYGKPVLQANSVRDAAMLVRETGDAELASLAAEGASFVESSGGWRGVALRTSEAIDALATVDERRSREDLLAQIGYLYPLVRRQRRTLEAMRVSRFWRLRDLWFAAKRRLGMGPAVDPVRLELGDDRAAELAALGDPYQLFRVQHRLRSEDVERIRAIQRFFPRAITFSILIDARRESSPRPLHQTLSDIREQLYPHWQARILVADSGTLAADVRTLAASDSRIIVADAAADRFGDAEFVLALDAGDGVEAHALFEFALALQGDADVVYGDEDIIDADGSASRPYFKPDWSPETFLTRDYIGRGCAVRRTLLEEAGGVRDVLASADWYDALLRITERTDRIVHVPQVLRHRSERNGLCAADQQLAVEVALRRRGEDATPVALDGGIEVRYAVPGDERVCIVVPTRDRADLLGPCLRSVFERSTYRQFEVVLVDNGSREPETLALLAEWQQREPQRFRVIRDPSPFNYSRLNNVAIRSSSAQYVVLLNNDTEVISADWIESMLGQARRPAIGAVGALLLYGDDTVQHGGVVLGILGLAGHAHRFLPGNVTGYHGGLRFDTNYLAVTGACLMVAKEKFEQVGGLDETLAVSYNDIDFCLKLRSAGYRNVLVPRARLHHYESKSRGTDDTPAKVARALAEVEQIRERWPAWSVRDPYYNPNLTVDAENFEVRL